MKEKIQLEYVVPSSLKVLYDHLSTPEGLSKWFADDVNVNGDEYTFIWEGEKQKAKITGKKNGSYVRFKWLDEEDDDKTYLEFRINKDEITNDIILLVTDFVEESERDDIIDLWDSQIEDLMQVLGV